MHLLLDNAVALIVVGTVLTIAAAMTLRNGEAVVDTHNMEALREHQLMFAEILRRDLQNVYEVSSTHDSTGAATAFSFHARIVDEQDNVLDRRITYRNVADGTRDGETVYRVERWEGGPSSGTSGIQPGDVRAGSVSGVAFWTIRARNEEAQNVADPTNTKQIYVRFEFFPPIQSGLAVIDKARFETTYRPALLQTDDVQPVL